MFQSFYESHYQQPLLLWIPQLVFIFWLLFRGKWDLVSKAALGFSLLSMTDAWLTATHVLGIGSLDGLWAKVVPVVFVVAGDFRYFLAADLKFITSLRGWSMAILWSLVVPVLALATENFGAGSNLRILYFVYEILFLIVLSVFVFVHRSRGTGGPFLKLSLYVFSYYFLWAMADLILLTTKSDWAFALRVIPNLMYYSFWAPLFFILNGNNFSSSRK